MDDPKIRELETYGAGGKAGYEFQRFIESKSEKDWALEFVDYHADKFEELLLDYMVDKENYPIKFDNVDDLVVGVMGSNEEVMVDYIQGCYEGLSA